MVAAVLKPEGDTDHCSTPSSHHCACVGLPQRGVPKGKASVLGCRGLTKGFVKKTCCLRGLTKQTASGASSKASGTYRETQW